VQQIGRLPHITGVEANSGKVEAIGLFAPLLYLFQRGGRTEQRMVNERGKVNVWISIYFHRVFEKFVITCNKEMNQQKFYHAAQEYITPLNAPCQWSVKTVLRGAPQIP
jgi:hypothetical protein